MEKVRVRHVVKSEKITPGMNLDHSYEVDSSKREDLSSILEKKLDDSLNELEKALKKARNNLDS